MHWLHPELNVETVLMHDIHPNIYTWILKLSSLGFSFDLSVVISELFGSPSTSSLGPDNAVNEKISRMRTCSFSRHRATDVRNPDLVPRSVKATDSCSLSLYAVMPFASAFSTMLAVAASCWAVSSSTFFSGSPLISFSFSAKSSFSLAVMLGRRPCVEVALPALTFL
jgi:hypothetical protein